MNSVNAPTNKCRRPFINGVGVAVDVSLLHQNNIQENEILYTLLTRGSNRHCRSCLDPVGTATLATMEERWIMIAGRIGHSNP